MWFWFAFPLWPELVSIFSCAFWPFEFLLLKKFCLVQLPISLLIHWFGGSLLFWAPCIKNSQILKTEIRMTVARVWGKERIGCFIIGIEFQCSKWILLGLVLKKMRIYLRLLVLDFLPLWKYLKKKHKRGKDLFCLSVSSFSLHSAGSIISEQW
jgi:hypothetical protein